MKEIRGSTFSGSRWIWILPAVLALAVGCYAYGLAKKNGYDSASAAGYATKHAVALPILFGLACELFSFTRNMKARVVAVSIASIVQVGILYIGGQAEANENNEVASSFSVTFPKDSDYRFLQKGAVPGDSSAYAAVVSNSTDTIQLGVVALPLDPQYETATSAAAGWEKGLLGDTDVKVSSHSTSLDGHDAYELVLERLADDGSAYLSRNLFIVANGKGYSLQANYLKDDESDPNISAFFASFSIR